MHCYTAAVWVAWAWFWCGCVALGIADCVRYALGLCRVGFAGVKVVGWVCLFGAIVVFSASGYVTVAVGVYLSAVTYFVIAVYFDFLFVTIVFIFTLLCFLWVQVRFAYAFLF